MKKMECKALFISVAVLVVISIAQINGLPYQLQIGGMFDFDVAQSYAAFARAAIWHNVRQNSTNDFQFLAYYQQLNTTNSCKMARQTCKFLGKKVVFIGGSNKMPSLYTMNSYANAYNTPYFTTSYSKEETGMLPSREEDYFFSVRPSLSRPLLDMLEFCKWQTFAYLYDDFAGVRRYQSLTSKFEEMGYKVVFRQISSENKTRKILKDLRDDNVRQIIGDFGIDSVRNILKQAKRLGMVTYLYHYIFLDLDVVKVDFSEFLYGGMNISGFSIINETHKYHNDFLRWWQRDQRRNMLKRDGDAEVQQRDELRVLNTSEVGARQPNGLALMDGPNVNVDVLVEADAALVLDMVQSFGATMKKLSRPIWDHFYIRYERDCRKEYRQDVIDGKVLEKLREIQFEGVTGHVQYDKRGERFNYSVNILGLTPRALKKVGVWYSEKNPPFKWRSQSLHQALFDHGEETKVAEENFDVYYSPMYGIYRINGTLRKNVTYKVVSVLEPPFLMYKDPKHNLRGNDRFEGYCIDLLKMITKIYPFNYEIHLSYDHNYGVQENGEWNGMVRELVDGRSHLAIAPLTINSEREKDIDFTKPFMSLGVSIMIKKPVASKPGVFSFMHPLSKEIWMCVAFAFIGVSVVLFLVSRFSSQEWYSESIDSVAHMSSLPRPIDDIKAMNPLVIEKKVNNFSFGNSIWFALGALMQQGGDTTPRSLSGRIVGGVWWFFTLILISSYTANLAAFLTVERMDAPIKSAKDLVDNKDMEYGLPKSGSTFELFKNSEIKTYQDMWKFMTKNKDRGGYMKDNEAGIGEVRKRNGKFAFLLESTVNEYESQRKPCDTMMVPQALDSKSYGIGVSKMFPDFENLRDQLTLAILELREEGKLAQLQKTWWFDKGQCGDSGAKDSSSPLSLSNVAGIFYILIAGLAFAMLIAVFEFYWRSNKDALKEKNGIIRAMKNKVRQSVTGEIGFRPVPLLLDGVDLSNKELMLGLIDHKDLLKKECGHTDV